MEKKWVFNHRSTVDDVIKGRNLNGKVAVVTGANTGLGFETARALASAGAKVILACRNPEKGRQAALKITSMQPSLAEFLPLDLASPQSIREFADSLEQREDLPQIDILVCNAGSISSTYLETEEGFERTFAVCHIGHFLLTKLLLPKLLSASAPRVVMLSSIGHRFPVKLNFDTLRSSTTKNSAASLRAYGQAKLCNILMAVELQNRYGSQGLTACSVHPGMLVTTDFSRESKFASLIFKLFSPLTKTPSQGAATTVFCALHEKADQIAGGYFSHCKPASCSAEAKNGEVAKKLWDLSEQLITA